MCSKLSHLKLVVCFLLTALVLAANTSSTELGARLQNCPSVVSLDCFVDDEVQTPVRCVCTTACLSKPPEESQMHTADNECSDGYSCLFNSIPSLELALDAGVNQLLRLAVFIGSVYLIAQPLVFLFAESGLQVLRLVTTFFTTILPPFIVMVGAASATGFLLSIHLLNVVIRATFLLTFRFLVLVFVVAGLLVRFLAAILAVTTILGLTSHVLHIVRHALASKLLDYLPHSSLNDQFSAEVPEGSHSSNAP